MDAGRNTARNTGKIVLKTEVACEVSGTSVTLRFELPPGHYATTVCREYMQGSPEQMV